MSTNPKADFIAKFCEKFYINPVWFLLGEGEPFPGARDKYPEICGPSSEDGAYVIEKGEDIAVDSLADQAYSPDPFGQATAGLRAIFDSQDPVLISAIQANIRAFQLAARREKQVDYLNQEIQKLKQECDKFKERIAALESKATSAQHEETNHNVLLHPLYSHPKCKK